MGTQLADRVFRTPMEDFTWRSVSRRAMAAVTALVLLRATVYAAFGAQLILDDWSILGAIRFSGLSEAAPSLQRPRPVAWLVDTVIYGGVGTHPLVLFAIITLLNVAAAVLLYVVMTRFVRPRTSFFVAGLWVLAANHNTMTVWTATAPTVVAVILVLLGVLAITNGRWVAATVFLSLSVLSYELTFPLCFVAAVAVPSSRGLGWRRRLTMVGGVALATGWVALDPVNTAHWNPPSWSLFWRAHFSDGLLGTASGPDRLVHYLGDLALVGVVVCVVAWIAGDRGRDDGPALALCGVLVMALGAVGVVTLGLGQEGIGMQDRLLAVSSIGSVMVLVGVLQLVAHHARAVAAVAAVVLCGVVVAGQWVSLRAWADAGNDAIAAMNVIDAVADPSNEAPVDVIVGQSAREHNGVIGISSPNGGGDMAYMLRFGRDAGIFRTVATEREFVATEPGQLLLDWDWIDNASVFDEGVGFIAAVTVPGPGQAMLYGWVEDGPPDAPPVEVEFLVDGDPVDRAVADVDRADIANALGRPNPNHAFEHLIEVPEGKHTICARTVGHGEVSLGCEDVKVVTAGMPVGTLESAVGVEPGVLELKGWAADHDAGTGPIPVQFTIGSNRTETATADQPRPDIEAVLAWEGGPNHGFVHRVEIPAGSYTVCAEALNVGEGHDAPLGACVPVTVP